MDRNLALGLSAVLNIGRAELDRAGRACKTAATHVDRAVAELHRAARWAAAELRRMGHIQGKSMEKLLTF